MKYVNAYELTQGYGGPEEGGWWYDVGTPLASVPIYDDQDPEPVIEDLKGKFSYYDNYRERTSAAGGADLGVWVQDHVAQDFPQARPHYE